LSSSPKNIVIIGPAHPLRGGLASYNERLARELVSMGNEVKIITFSLQYPGFLFPGTTQYSSEPKPKDLNIEALINSVNPFNWLVTGNKIRRMKPDLVIVRYWLPFMGPCLGTLLRIIKKNKHTRTVCIADNVIPHEKRPGDIWFTRYFIKPVDAFLTMSEKVMNDLKSFDNIKPAIFVPHPLYDNFGNKISKSEARKNLGLPQEGKIILFFGFIRQYKGLDILLEAISILKKKFPSDRDVKFMIAGEFYEDRKIYDELIRALEISDSLILRTDFIPDSEVRNYLCASDGVIQPYRNATQSGVTPLAYHFEIPMIVTNVGGLPSLVPDGKVGLVAEPDAESIADAIHRFFVIGADQFIPELVKEKTKYSWTEMAGKLLSL